VAWTAEMHHQNKIHEHGARSLNLILQAENKWLTSSLLGVHLNGSFEKKTALALDLAWQHYYGNLRVDEKTHFKDFGNFFLIQGPKRGHNGAIGTLHISTTLGKCWKIDFKTSGQIWKDWHAYEFDAGVSF
jgi:hypothetical protein